MTTVEHRGEHGTAVLLTIPADDPRTTAALDYWLITAPGYHPAWSQYVLACVRLGDIPGYPPLRQQFTGATHEVTVAALSPTFGPYTAATASQLMAGAGLPILSPVNVVEQFEATDDEMHKVCELAVQAVVAGDLCPETDYAAEAVREAWLTKVVRTLAHLRGEDHA